MSFVPVVVPPPPSPRALELSRRISELIEQFLREQPGTSDTDVRRALDLAATSRGSAQKLAMKLVLVGIVLLGLLLLIYLKSS